MNTHLNSSASLATQDAYGRHSPLLPEPRGRATSFLEKRLRYELSAANSRLKLVPRGERNHERNNHNVPEYSSFKSSKKPTRTDRELI